MIRKSVKYLGIVFINLIILTGLLAYWTDSLELIFNHDVRTSEFLKILGFSTLSLIAIRIAIIFFRKQHTSPRKRIRIASAITLLISSFLYFNYSKKIVDHRILNSELRNELAMKIEPANILAFGTKANNLTHLEYEEITKTIWFPKIQKNASNISYYYTYDGFLPDYSFHVSYNLPKDAIVDSKTLNHGKIVIDTVGNIKRINYNEYED